MGKRFIMWVFFTLLFGMLPLIFLILTSLIMEERISLISTMKELFFLTIILCADTLKTLYELDNKELIINKAFLHGISIFILIISSVLYGIMLIFNREIVNINVYMLSAILCGISVGIGGFTQILINRKSNI